MTGMIPSGQGKKQSRNFHSQFSRFDSWVATLKQESIKTKHQGGNEADTPCGCLVKLQKPQGNPPNDYIYYIFVWSLLPSLIQRSKQPNPPIFSRHLKPTHTPPKFNITPEKWWLEDDPIGNVTFQGRTVELREGTEKRTSQASPENPAQHWVKAMPNRHWSLSLLPLWQKKNIEGWRVNIRIYPPQQVIVDLFLVFCISVLHRLWRASVLTYAHHKNQINMESPEDDN